MITQIQPPKQVGINKAYPLLFLAGPIQGAPEWQKKTVEVFKKLGDKLDLTIANPRRDTFVKSEFNYEDQVNWESKYLEKSDVIMFWLPLEAEKVEGRSYGQTTRFELGEWFGRNPDKIIVGIEPGFEGERYPILKLKQIGIETFTTLSDTIKAVIRRIK